MRRRLRPAGVIAIRGVQTCRGDIAVGLVRPSSVSVVCGIHWPVVVRRTDPRRHGKRDASGANVMRPATTALDIDTVINIFFIIFL